MAEYIDREAFIKRQREHYCADCERRKGLKNGKWKTLYDIGDAPCRACGVDDALDDLELFPAADVKPVVRGKWRRTDAYPHRLYCSACFRSYLPNDEILQMYRIPMNYCPNCGARMDGEADE